MAGFIADLSCKCLRGLRHCSFRLGRNACKLITNKARVRLFLSHFYRNRGLPKTILSDNGFNLSSQFWEELFRNWEYMSSTSSKYHPQSHRRVERMNSTILDMLRTISSEDRED